MDMAPRSLSIGVISLVSLVSKPIHCGVSIYGETICLISVKLYFVMMRGFQSTFGFIEVLKMRSIRCSRRFQAFFLRDTLIEMNDEEIFVEVGIPNKGIAHGEGTLPDLRKKRDRKSEGFKGNSAMIS